MFELDVAKTKEACYQDQEKREVFTMVNHDILIANIVASMQKVAKWS